MRRDVRLLVVEDDPLSKALSTFLSHLAIPSRASPPFTTLKRN
jgi:hypothetical protein